MKVEILKESSGLVVGKVYNLHHVAAGTLVRNGEAKLAPDKNITARKGDRGVTSAEQEKGIKKAADRSEKTGDGGKK